MKYKRMGGLVLIEDARKFRLLERRGRYYIECLDPKAEPRVRRVSRKDAHYLTFECGKRNFSAACVIDFGVGVFAKKV